MKKYLRRPDGPKKMDTVYPSFLAPDTWVLVHLRTGSFIKNPKSGKFAVFPDSASAHQFATNQGFRVRKGPRDDMMNP